jgi:hypothetical protein
MLNARFKRKIYFGFQMQVYSDGNRLLKQEQVCGDKAEGMFENDDLDYPSNTHFHSSGGAYPGGVEQRCSS